MKNNEMIDVIMAHSNGKSIQYTVINAAIEHWSECNGTPSWDFSMCKFRIKPDPPCLYGVRFRDGTLSQVTWHIVEFAEDYLVSSAPYGSSVVKLIPAPDEEQPL